jgi:RNA polymerase sigma factor (TIGR02999 family)
VSDAPPEAITRHLQEWRDGDPEALPRLTAALYSELRRVAAGIIRGGSGSQTVRPTGLVHELYLRLPALKATDWQSRGQFLNLAAAVMRNLLVDRARRRRAAKRGGGLEMEFLSEPAKNDPNLCVDVLLVHDLLNRFAAGYPRQAKVVELKFFGGLTEGETSVALRASGIESSERTVARDWKFARAWLHDQLEQGSAERP